MHKKQKLILNFSILALLLLVATSCGRRKAKPADLDIDIPKLPLQIIDVKKGKGKTAKIGNSVSVHYTGHFEDGTQFDNSRSRNQPLVFVIGSGRVIKGWDQGITGMRVGGHRKLIIPPHLAYGKTGISRMIPGNATLLFEVELVDVKEVEAVKEK